jgi:3'(2'), 5'-bisphosphate nucleotidase
VPIRRAEEAIQVRRQSDAPPSPDARLAERLTAVAIEASAAILAVDFRKAGTRRKADSSMVTEADEAAQAVILEGLARVAPDIPVVSEEAPCDWHGKAPAEFLLVDPLDGTAEFLAGRLEYTVNIALVRNGIPAAGVVAAPALGLIWRGATDHGAARVRFSLGDTKGRPRKGAAIHTRPWPAGEPVAAISRSHYDPTSAAFLARLGPVRPLSCGSALKFCRLAEGAIDVYPRLAPTFEWDVAAGHAVVVAAGGSIVAADGGKLMFGRVDSGFHVPGFVAWGDPRKAKAFGHPTERAR